MTIFQFLTFYINENVPKRRTKFAKVSSKLCQILNIRSKELSKTFKILPKWRNFAKSGHTVRGEKKLKLISSMKYRLDMECVSENGGLKRSAEIRHGTFTAVRPNSNNL